MRFNADWLASRLEQLTDSEVAQRWIVAFSGGMDSSVLLHALAGVARDVPVLAVHIQHGLHEDAGRWAMHCQAFAAGLGVEYFQIEVNIPETAPNGPEAAARDARYGAFADLLQAGDCLLSAHHQADQGETLLLNLMRGSGVDGLAAISDRQPFAAGRLLRPMLAISAAELYDYAQANALEWVEDPSNDNTAFDRNYLRQRVIPLLRERWPAVSERLAVSASLLGEARDLLREQAVMDIARHAAPERLMISALLTLSPARQRNVLRHAVRLCGLPAPPATRLRQILDELMLARADAQPLVSWPGAEVRRYRDEIFLLSASPLPEHPLHPLRAGQPDLALGSGQGSLRLQLAEGSGIAPQFAEAGLNVQFRAGGEKLRLNGREGEKTLKTLFQEAAILPWMRPRIPLLYAGDALVAVGDLWIAADALAMPGYCVRWLEKPPLI